MCTNALGTCPLPKPCQFTDYCKNTLKLAAAPFHLLSLLGSAFLALSPLQDTICSKAAPAALVSLTGICKGWRVDTGAQSPPAYCLSQMYADRNVKLSQNTDVWLCCHCLTPALYFLYHVC